MIRSLALLALVPAAAAAQAVPFQDTVAIDRAVAGFTGQRIGAEGGARTPVDPRLRLAACPMAAMAWRTDSHDAVVVTCSGPTWRLFVPVAMPATPSPAAAPMMAAVHVEPVIRRGDPVMIEAASAGFAISRDGVAMGDAAPGQRFLVKIEETKNPVQAVAIASGRATLPGWSE